MSRAIEISLRSHPFLALLEPDVRDSRRERLDHEKRQT